MPDWPSIEDCEEKSKTHQRKQIVQSAARFGDLQFVAAQVDDVAVEIDRYAQPGDDCDTDFRRYGLELGRKLPIDEVRKRQHEYQIGPGCPKFQTARPASQNQYEACQAGEKAICHNIGYLGQIAEQANNQPSD